MKCFELVPKVDIFMMKKRFNTSDYGSDFCHHTVLVSCCKKYVNFQMVLENSIWNFFSRINCCYVREDMTVYYDGYEQQYYIQSNNYIRDYNNNNQATCIDHETIIPEEPARKSCFMSSARFCYRDFCANCKKVFKETIERQLIVFSRKDDK